ncbi:phage tail protein [Paracidovorax avenae]|uniref:phage tail protein n=1 Tax=Paracidovorax avenae TaxID=80867 RepID=UPI000D2206E6|nr:phage tail protein [Paracidovorax avenae]AVS66641.1 phage tail protein [Paracidovorax avenae]
MTATATRAHILPPNATPLERAIDQTAPAWDHIAEAFTPPGAGGSQPGFAPWLAAEYELAEFSPYFDDVQSLIAEGLRWLFQRGTMAAALRALSWVGFAGARVEEDGPYLHIHTGRIPSMEEVRRIAHVVRASLPAHQSLYRLVHGLDLRPVVADAGPEVDVGLLDGYSGVLDPATGVVLSFGHHRTTVAPPLPMGQPQGARRGRRIYTARYDDEPLLDAWRLDSQILIPAAGGVRRRRTSSAALPERPDATAARRSVRGTAAPLQRPAPTSARRHISARAAPVLMFAPRRWGGPWGGTYRPHAFYVNRTTN